MVTRNVKYIFNEAITYMKYYYSTNNLEYVSFKEFKLTYNHNKKTLNLNVILDRHNQFTLTSWYKFNLEMYEKLISIIKNFENKEQIPISFSK